MGEAIRRQSARALVVHQREQGEAGLGLCPGLGPAAPVQQREQGVRGLAAVAAVQVVQHQGAVAIGLVVGEPPEQREQHEVRAVRPVPGEQQREQTARPAPVFTALVEQRRDDRGARAGLSAGEAPEQRELHVVAVGAIAFTLAPVEVEQRRDGGDGAAPVGHPEVERDGQGGGAARVAEVPQQREQHPVALVRPGAEERQREQPAGPAGYLVILR